MSIDDRIRDTLAWDTLTRGQWYALVGEALRRGDIEAIPKALALMAVHGYPDEADELRRTMRLLTSKESA